MPSKDELAKEYAARLKASVNKEHEAKEIYEEIKGLKYVSTGAKLTKEDKKGLLELIIGKIRGPVIIKEADNHDYLQLIHYMMTQLDQERE